MVSWKYKELLFGALVGLAVWFVTDYLSVKQDLVTLSSVTLDSNEKKTGLQLFALGFRFTAL